MIPYGKQDISERDIAAVIEVLRSDFLTQGPMVPRFESAVADYTGSGNAVAVSSATAALHLACLALELGEGDWLWTSPITFVASANCGRYCGAQIDFVDIDSRTYNICPQALEQKLVKAKKAGNLPKIVVVVHLGGQPCNMVAIHTLSQRYGFRIIEDASHAIGAKYKGEPVGSGRYSDITVFSFHPVKVITTGEGGMALSNNEEVARRMEMLRSHGITRNSDEMRQISDGPWYYQQIDLGFNYRMTDMQAALGISQLKRLDKFIARRHELAKRYQELLENLPVDAPWQDPDCYSSLHLYPICLKLDEINTSHRQVFESMRSQGIGVNLHYIPVHTQPYYQALGFKWGDFPVAEDYYSRAITLPLFSSMTNQQQDLVVAALREALQS